MLSEGTPGAPLNTECPSWTSATGSGESPPPLRRLRGSPYILERKRGTLCRSRLKAVIIRGIRRPPPPPPHPLCLLLSCPVPLFLLPFVISVLFPLTSYFETRHLAVFSFSLSLFLFSSVLLSPRLFLFKLRIPRVPPDFYLNVICILRARPFDSFLPTPVPLVFGAHVTDR